MKRISSLDILNQLREYKTQKKPIKIKDNYLYFGSTKFPLTTETMWQSKQTSKRYDLGSLWFFLEHHEKQSSTSQYYNEVTALKLQMVSNVDKEDIINYFTGKVDNSECINQELAGTLKRPSKRNDPAGNPKKKFKKNETIENSQEPNANNDEQLDKEKEQIKIIEFLSKFEKPLDSKNKAMRKYNKSFKNVLEYIDKLIIKEDDHKQAPIGERDRSRQITQKSLIDELLQQEKDMLNEGKPIILVPKFAKKGNLDVGNAINFLLHGRYEESTEESQHATEKQEIIKEIGKRRVTFEIRNDVVNFREETWKRLVAVLLEGVNNEFREWPDGNKPAILFSKIKGFFMKYHDVPLSDNINQLNVTKLNIHRNKRFLDNSVKDQFWEELEKFLLRPRMHY